MGISRLRWSNSYVSDLGYVELRLLLQEAALLSSLTKIPVFKVLHDVAFHCALVFASAKDETPSAEQALEKPFRYELPRRHPSAQPSTESLKVKLGLDILPLCVNA
jgi:hypothetical protein